MNLNSRIHIILYGSKSSDPYHFVWIQILGSVSFLYGSISSSSGSRSWISSSSGSRSNRKSINIYFYFYFLSSVLNIFKSFKSLIRSKTGSISSQIRILNTDPPRCKNYLQICKFSRKKYWKITV